MISVDLKGRRALVAGVADDVGFGFAIARTLAEAGASVCLACWPPALGIFETLLRRYDLADPALWRLAQVVHEADIDDGLYDAPEAPGFDVALRGLSMVAKDEEVLTLTGLLFDGAYEFFRRELLLGKEPA